METPPGKKMCVVVIGISVHGIDEVTRCLIFRDEKIGVESGGKIELGTRR